MPNAAAWCSQLECLNMGDWGEGAVEDGAQSELVEAPMTPPGLGLSAAVPLLVRE